MSVSLANASQSPPTDLGRSPIRLTFVQPALPKYNVPFFKELAARPGIKLVLYYGKVTDLPNEPPDGFEAHFEPYWEGHLRSQPVWWHGAQWRRVNRAADVVVLTASPRYLSIFPALLRARMLGIPTVFWWHGYSKAENAFRIFMRKQLARQAAALVFYARRNANQWLAEGWPKEKVFVAPNSLDQEAIKRAQAPWRADPARLARFQTENRLRPESTLIYVGRIKPENRLEKMITALPDIAHRHPNVQLVVIGKDNEHAQILQQLARELKVEGRVRWVGAIYDEEKLAPWMLSASLFCFPHNIGLSIMHAMGYGLPVVTCDCIGRHNPEVEILTDSAHYSSKMHGPEIAILQHGNNGRFFQLDDLHSLATTLIELLANPKALKKMSLAARRAVEAEYTIPKMADGFEAAVRYAYSLSGNQRAGVSAARKTT